MPKKKNQDEHTWIRLSQVTVNITVGNRFKIKISLLEKQNKNYNWLYDKTTGQIPVSQCIIWMSQRRELRLPREL